MTTENPIPEKSCRFRGERGATLVIALAFLATIGVVAVGVLGFGDASVRATAGYRSDRARSYAADGALDAAINRVKEDPNVGRDPALFPTDTCNPANNESLIKLPATSTEPATVVSCEVAPDSGSGAPRDLGTNPPYALLTLGDRRTDGTNDSLGVRNNEPGPFNGAGNSLFNACGGNRQETGIRFNTALYPFDVLAPLFYDCFESPRTGSQWRVRGDIFSNSKIQIDPSSSAPTIVVPTSGPTGTIKARGGCSGSGLTCTDVGWNFADGLGQDPGLTNPTDYQNYPIAGLPVVTMDTSWINARVAECGVGNHVVKFTPGIYTDGTAMNSLFGNAGCKNATFWFAPDDHGTTDTTDDTTGVFYFDFRNTSAPGYACGTDINFFPVPTGDLSHSWCVGGRASDYSGQRVVGGTPYNWSPSANPSTHIVAVEPAASAGNGTGIFSFLQQTNFSNPANAKSIDGSTANLLMDGGRPGGSIWMSGYPIPRGSFSEIDLEVAHSGENVNRMNAPTIQVNYGSLFSGGSCGPYTLPKPPTDGSIATVKLSAANPTAWANLKACLSVGDRLQTAVVQYNTGRPLFQGSPYPTAKLDGVRFLITATDGPQFPQLPNAAAGNPGGDCDPTQPGAQFIFGGDSRVYVPNGSLEVCAGPNPTAPAQGKQIAVYGAPAAPRLVPTGVSSVAGNDGVDNPDNALRIADPSGAAPASANIRYSHSGGCFFCNDIYEGTMALGFAAYPYDSSKFTVSNVELRASYDANGSTTPIAELVGASGAGCDNTVELPGGTDPQARAVDVTACMTNGGHLTAPFDVKWHARSQCSFFQCPAGNGQLDGIEFIVTLTPIDADTTIRPATGCVLGTPNFWYGTSSPDCALLKADAPFWSALSPRRGRISIKGTLYAPSDAVEIDDGDVYYPLVSRGAIVRHFRLTGFNPHPGYLEPAFDNWVDSTAAGREVVFFACAKSSGSCTQGDPTLQGRAAATFEAITGDPTVKSWSNSQR